MPQFEIRHIDGSERIIITATRMVADGEHTVFHRRVQARFGVARLAASRAGGRSCQAWRRQTQGARR